MPRSRALCFIDLSRTARPFTLLVACLFFVVARAASAAEQALYVVIVGRATSPLLQRLREESEALGFTVNSKTTGARTLELELDVPGVVAAIRELEPPDDALELVIADPELRERLRETLPIRASTDPTAREVVATRAIELLRAVRLHVERAAPPPPRPAPAPPVAARHAETVNAKTAIGLAPLLSYAPDFNLGMTADVYVSYVPRHIGVSGGLLVPIVAQRLEHADGEITAAATAIHGAVIARTSARPALSAELGLGFEASRVHFEGHAPAPLINVGSNLYTFGPRFEFSGALRLASHVRLVLPIALSYALPETVIRFAGEPIQDWGEPLLRAGLGVEWVVQ
ncbi:MAG TPA: hypothetical protein VER96_05910 [Polyangiaceae bacterium]|nr:hypothetical protein [Polyangiaceae bacterium]